jgi:HK97 family phage prohead protease
MAEKKQRRYFSIKAATDAPGTFYGTLSPYGNVDDVKDVVERGAFTKTILERGGSVPCLWQHRSDTPIGTLELIDTPTGLDVKGTLLIDSVSQAREAYALISSDPPVIKGLSIGFQVMRKENKDGIRYIKEAALWEGSVVTFPANHDAQIMYTKGMMDGTTDFEEELSEMQAACAGYQAYDVLGDCLMQPWWMVSYGEGSPEMRSYVASTLEAFTTAFLGAFDRYAAIMAGGDPDEMKLLRLKAKTAYMAHKSAVALETHSGKRISAETADQMKKAHGTVNAAIEQLKSAGNSLQSLYSGPAADDLGTDPNSADPVKSEAPLDLEAKAKADAEAKALSDLLEEFRKVLA